jgi:hypothetical protein
MANQMATRSRATTGSPVDDRLYNVLQALTSKLEAIDAYDRYSRDGEGELFSELAADERRHAERLLEALRQALGSR